MRGGALGWTATGLATVAGAAAGFNRLATWNRPALPPPFESAERTLATPDGDIRIYERGSGPTTLLIHSFNAAASAYELRPLVERLSADRRVVTFDWLGFGRSDRPPLRYDAALYQEQLGRLLDDLGSEALDVVALSLPGQYVAIEATRRPERFRRLVFISPTGFGRFGGAAGAGGRLRLRLLRSPVFGEAFFNLLVTRASIRWFERQIFADRDRVPDDLVDYYWRTGHQPGARWAPSSFVADQLDAPDARAAFAALSAPSLFLFGERARFTDPDAARALAAENPALSIETLTDSGDLPQWEQPERTFDLIDGFLQGGPASTESGRRGLANVDAGTSI